MLHITDSSKMEYEKWIIQNTATQLFQGQADHY